MKLRIIALSTAFAFVLGSDPLHAARIGAVEEPLIVAPGHGLVEPELAALVLQQAICGPGPSLAAAPAGDDAEQCLAREDDEEAWLAASLLWEKLGEAAAPFAEQRAARAAAENNPDAAELWRRILQFVATITRGR